MLYSIINFLVLLYASVIIRIYNFFFVYNYFDFAKYVCCDCILRFQDIQHESSYMIYYIYIALFHFDPCWP